MDMVGRVAHLEFRLVNSDPEKMKEALAKWNKDKNLPKDVLEEAYNHILGKCNIEALVLGREMQLPAHIPLPKVKSN